MAIYLIRHGETPSNAARVIQIAETRLSDRGVEQAERLAARLASAGIEHILASDLERAQMTARLLAGSTGAPIELEPLLQERNFGDLRGTPYAELETDPFAADYTPPGGESWSVFYERVERAWQRVLAVEAGIQGHLAVVTHGLVCHAVAARHVTEPASAEGKPGDGPPVGNTSVTILEGPSPWRVELFACTRHLEQTPEGAPV